MKRNLLWVFVAFLLLSAARGFMGRPAKVEAVRPVTKDLAEVIALSGRVHGVEESQLAPEVIGTLRAFLVNEGATVKKGQKLAELDTGVLRSQLEQARNGVSVAQAQLAVASRGPLPSEVEEVRAEVKAQQLAAAANLESARQQLLEAERGPRAEDIEGARASLQQARAEAEQRVREAERQLRLVADGAVSRQSAEQAATLARQAGDAAREAEARLRLLENGTRSEQLEQARQAVRAADAERLAADRGGQSRLQALLDQPRPEDIELAKAQLEQARSAARIAEENLAQAVVVAPYDGVVGRKLLRVGDLAGPTQPLLSFSSRPSLEIRVDVDESDRARLSLGQEAQIRANGYGETLTATVREIAPEIDTLRGTIEARLAPQAAPDWLVPGQTVDVNLILSQQQPHLVLPLTSVLLRGDSAQVVLLKDGLVEFRAVEVSAPTEDGYLIRSGLDKDDLVARYPQGLDEGQKVRVQAES